MATKLHIRLKLDLADPNKAFHSISSDLPSQFYLLTNFILLCYDFLPYNCGGSVNILNKKKKENRNILVCSMHLFA